MTFAEPLWLLLLAGVPLLWWRRTRPALRFGTAREVAGLPSTWRTRTAWVPDVVRAACIVLAVLALARPQGHEAPVYTSEHGIDIMVALDVSTSMRAQDMLPNRFTVARETAARFVDRHTRRGDRVGLIAFAGRAHTLAPPTSDGRYLQERIALLEPGMLEDGTAIGMAVAHSANRLRFSEAESRVIVLLTDGENNRGEIDPYTAGAIAEALGIRIYSVGITGSLPADVPREGEYATLPPDEIDEAMMRAIAERTGGAYFRAADLESLTEIYDRISEMEQSPLAREAGLVAKEYYGRLVGPAAVLFLLHILLSATAYFRIP
jgi:Ca-activated chloride channel homolog